MTKTIEGIVVFAEYEKNDVFNWTDPATGQTKPLRSLKVLLAHGDGTVTRESVGVNRHATLTPYRRAMLTPSGRRFPAARDRSCAA